MGHHHDGHLGPERSSEDRTADAGLADLLGLDGEVLSSYWTDVLTCVRHAASGGPRQRILDLGAGPGTATIGLAQRFGGAEVIAVDVSEEMLRRIRVTALDLGLAERIRTHQADLDAAWPAIGPIDVTWASMSLHHLSDPDRVLGEVHGATRPGGLIAVAEFSEPLRFLPDDLGFGRPGLERRCLDLLAEEHAHAVPELGSEWAPRLESAGFTVLSERTFTIDLTPPLPARAAQYARLWFGRMRSGLADRLADDDVAVLADLVDGDGPGSLQRRGDLHVRGSRTLALARRS